MNKHITRQFHLFTSKPGRKRTLIEQYRHWRAVKKPPYKHVVQIGDPVLRRVCQEIPRNEITSPKVKNLVQQLTTVMRRKGLTSLSAPQIGVPVRMFAAEQADYHLKNIPQEELDKLEITPFELKVLINPKLQVIDETLIEDQEMCYSVHNYHATVKRHKTVQIDAFDDKGEVCQWFAQGWQARIAQHEFDHMNGVLFIDKMDPKTLADSMWKIYNDQGKLYW